MYGTVDSRMHEASLVEGLMKIALHAAEQFQQANPQAKTPKIKEIVCEAGLLTGVEEETLRACFEIFSENTIAEGANLVVNTAPLQCDCNACGHKFTLSKRHFVCPACASENIKFNGGGGLMLQSINIDCGEEGNG